MDAFPGFSGRILKGASAISADSVPRCRARLPRGDHKPVAPMIGMRTEALLLASEALHLGQRVAPIEHREILKVSVRYPNRSVLSAAPY
jgi:hypothetical protein